MIYCQVERPKDNYGDLKEPSKITTEENEGNCLSGLYDARAYGCTTISIKYADRLWELASVGGHVDGMSIGDEGP